MPAERDEEGRDGVVGGCGHMDDPSKVLILDLESMVVRSTLDLSPPMLNLEPASAGKRADCLCDERAEEWEDPRVDEGAFEESSTEFESIVFPCSFLFPFWFSLFFSLFIASLSLSSLDSSSFSFPSSNCSFPSSNCSFPSSNCSFPS
eukprot:CAMPEP_0175079104 /NCGR_PEP_ID=MMETSP0052_2-20121109/24618_1 /TAXON_ID=51329 ORGANISM="Polytomella parva, Strain SAG 63-3" /NCGR_SAMPLE_ID=MMETSP0052_2 /ASSEMBLY_ACC=CAM_ASM_000194 /LENGTH=147 /DNA_ID=CAMNT_0016349359 /DNA_START=445 /DNA_END=885 /DNA_ORIENTATION=+